jgi:hypothetical protein
LARRRPRRRGRRALGGHQGLLPRSSGSPPPPSTVIKADRGGIAAGQDVNLTKPVGKRPRKLREQTRISLAWPKLLSKRKSAQFVLTVYPRSRCYRAEDNRNEMRSSRDSEVRIGDRINVSLHCPVVDFVLTSATLEIDDDINQAIFLGMPNDHCQNGENAAVVSILNKKNGTNYQCVSSKIKVVDLAFGVVSRIFLSQFGSVCFAIIYGSLFALT